MTEVDIDTRIAGGRTIIEVSGTRDVAVVVRSESGERIYLPPEEFDEPVEADPYRSPYQSSYARGDADEESPYREAPESTRGVVSTAEGFRIRHGEPAGEVNVYREA